MICIYIYYTHTHTGDLYSFTTTGPYPIYGLRLQYHSPAAPKVSWRSGPTCQPERRRSYSEIFGAPAARSTRRGTVNGATTRTRRTDGRTVIIIILLWYRVRQNFVWTAQETFIYDLDSSRWKYATAFAVRGMERGAMSSYANARWNGCDGREVRTRRRAQKTRKPRKTGGGGPVLTSRFGGDLRAPLVIPPLPPIHIALDATTRQPHLAGRPVTAECIINKCYFFKIIMHV